MEAARLGAIRCSSVDTNSITQGADDRAAVHCVIIDLSHAPNDRERLIFDGDKKIIAANINWYLLDAPDVEMAAF